MDSGAVDLSKKFRLHLLNFITVLVRAYLQDFFFAVLSLPQRLIAVLRVASLVIVGIPMFPDIQVTGAKRHRTVDLVICIVLFVINIRGMFMLLSVRSCTINLTHRNEV